MSSSVSSERAFSQGAITITKRRNRLKGDIVEALQCLKSGIKNDAFLQDPVKLEVCESEDEQTDTDNFSLDGIFIEDDDEEALYDSYEVSE
jgi:hAT family C-terminal dimerisation region